MADKHERGVMIVTQAMDEQDPVLGFFVEWVRRLVAGEAHVLVACWKKSQQLSLPDQVEVIELPRGALRRSLALMRLSWRARRRMRAVFVHMIPPVVVALGPWWRMLGWRTVLWYTHGSVPWSLRVAEPLCDAILTASKESCRLRSRKVRVVGHGIDLERFRPGTAPREPWILTVGRIAPRKHLEAVIELCAQLKKTVPELRFRCLVAGEPRTPGDRAYLHSLKTYAQAQAVADVMEWRGAVTGDALIDLYQRAAVFVSSSLTGSLDKVVLEAMACETPVVAIGDQYRELTGARTSKTLTDPIALHAVATDLKQHGPNKKGRATVQDMADLNVLVQRIKDVL